MTQAIPITLPELGAPARFSLWHVGVGEQVFEGDRIAEVFVPGATYDIPAPATGRIVERTASAHDPLTTGQVLGTLTLDD